MTHRDPTDVSRPLEGLIPPAVLADIVGRYALDPRGAHGLGHWARVLEIGLRLAETTGADPRIIALFAIFHDSCRLNEGYDPEHGVRGARLAREILPRHIEIAEDDLELLVYACTYHADGLTDDDVTVGTCWDSDRLDLGRVGIRPRTRYLCTEPGRDPTTIDWANRRAISGFVPRYVIERWLAPG